MAAVTHSTAATDAILLRMNKGVLSSLELALYTMLENGADPSWSWAQDRVYYAVGF